MPWSARRRIAASISSWVLARCYVHVWGLPFPITRQYTSVIAERVEAVTTEEGRGSQDESGAGGAAGYCSRLLAWSVRRSGCVNPGHSPSFDARLPGILLLSPWKTPIVRRGSRRSGRAGSSLSILLTVVLITLASGLLHAHGEISRIGLLMVYADPCRRRCPRTRSRHRPLPASPGDTSPFRCRPASFPANLGAVGGRGQAFGSPGRGLSRRWRHRERAPVHRHARERVTRPGRPAHHLLAR